MSDNHIEAEALKLLRGRGLAHDEETDTITIRAAIKAMVDFRALSPQPTSENDAALIECIESAIFARKAEFGGRGIQHQNGMVEAAAIVRRVIAEYPDGPEAAARIAILGAERDTAQSLVEAWACIVEGLEAHIMDRKAMGDPASPTTYLSILRANVARVLEDSKRVRASRWHDAKRARDQVDRLGAENARLREAGQKVVDCYGVGWGTNYSALIAAIDPFVMELRAALGDE